MGASGTDVYKLYAATQDTQSSISLSNSGRFSIKNDYSIEIISGYKSDGKNEDIVIAGLSGNVNIVSTHGTVRIKAANIILSADEDIMFKAGRNITLKSGSGRTLIQGNKVDVKGSTGTLIQALGEDFTTKVFSDSFVGADVLKGLFGGLVGTVIDTVL
jgi:lipopolysaccharide assembly outer membrane protein LptD (OstA)